jgi:hypothetical protein
VKKIAAVLLAGGLLTGVVAQAGAAAPKPAWTDDAGDADNGQDLGASIPGGLDLVSGTIVKNKDNLDFTVTHADMLPSGSLPEGFRFMWSFAVGGKSYRVTAKSQEIGKPNPVDQSGTDQIGKVHPSGFFRLEGNCGAMPVGSVTAVTCPTIAYLEGTLDPASKSFTFSVPMKDIKAKPGSVVSTGAGDAATLCKATACWTSHTAERSLDTTIIDAAIWTSSYKIPKK